MTKVMKVAALAAAMAMACAPLPAQAAGCWAAQDIAAAKVRDLQTMLMVATLRCRADGMDVSADYNDFVVANRDAITAMNQRLKAHFWAAGSVDGQAQYDRFVTALANAYGDDDTGGDSCAEASAVSREAVSAGSADALVAIGEAQRRDPALPGGSCGVTLASRDH